MSAQRHIHHLHSAGHTATISDYGAQILSWNPNDSAPVLWMSILSDPQTADAPRGGIPLCLPWFGRPQYSALDIPASAPSHGVARTQLWECIEATAFSTHHQLVHHPTDEFTHHFTADFHTMLSSNLVATLVVTNTGTDVMPLEHAFHTYFSVGDLKDVTVQGLRGRPFRTAGRELELDQNSELYFVRPTDRIYSADAPVTIIDPRLQRRIVIDFDGARSIIVWTPWACGSASMFDVPDCEWDKFLCVEVGNVWDHALTLQPGESHAVSMRLSAEPLA